MRQVDMLLVGYKGTRMRKRVVQKDRGGGREKTERERDDRRERRRNRKKPTGERKRKREGGDTETASQGV